MGKNTAQEDLMVEVNSWMVSLSDGKKYCKDTGSENFTERFY